MLTEALSFYYGWKSCLFSCLSTSAALIFLLHRSLWGALYGHHISWSQQLRLCLTIRDRNKVQTVCYCSSVNVPGICTLSIYLSDNYWLFLPTFEHKYLNSLLLTFPQQARDFSLNSFEGNNGFNLFASVACRLSNVTRLISVGARHSRQT